MTALPEEFLAERMSKVRDRVVRMNKDWVLGQMFRGYHPNPGLEQWNAYCRKLIPAGRNWRSARKTVKIGRRHYIPAYHGAMQ